MRPLAIWLQAVRSASPCSGLVAICAAQVAVAPGARPHGIHESVPAGNLRRAGHGGNSDGSRMTIWMRGLSSALCKHDRRGLTLPRHAGLTSWPATKYREILLLTLSGRQSTLPNHTAGGRFEKKVSRRGPRTRDRFVEIRSDDCGADPRCEVFHTGHRARAACSHYFSRRRRRSHGRRRMFRCLTNGTCALQLANPRQPLSRSQREYSHPVSAAGQSN